MRECTHRMMIVYSRNGVPQTVTGWRAWLLLIVGALLFVVVGGLVLGVALTVWMILLIAVPIALVIGFVMSVFARRI